MEPIPHKILKSLCTLTLCDDKSQLERQERAEYIDWLTRHARVLGYTDWVDCAHSDAPQLAPMVTIPASVWSRMRSIIEAITARDVCHVANQPMYRQGLILKKTVDTLVTEIRQAEPASAWCPDKCPITQAPFMCWILHPVSGWVPTYGDTGHDSYTIPELQGAPDQPWHERALVRDRYDHDLDAWMDEGETIDLRLASEQALMALHVYDPPEEQASAKLDKLKQLVEEAREANVDEYGGPGDCKLSSILEQMWTALA